MARLFLFGVGMVAGLAWGGHAWAEDWGFYSIIPVSAPALVLETVTTEPREGVAVSLGRPAMAAHQKWVLVSRGGRLVAIKPSLASPLVLAVSKGATANGTAIVLETDLGQPWQLWAVNPQGNGSYTLTPQHAPAQGLDDFGGSTKPGARIDLWENRVGDPHLQWRIQPLAGSPLPLPSAAEFREYVPPALKPGTLLSGVLKQATFSRSRIFPGTTRGVTVFIPAQYDGTKPACVYVKTDGYNPREKVQLETLIATGEMPVTIGVFVAPGTLPAPMKGTVDRRNRCLEYDGVGSENVRFLVDELLPFVAQEFALNLSTDGNDRCLSGGSSGGIAAFTAAWHRPEAFSRVYAASGSWVAFRGGHEFPTLVRKYEAKPIRAFLTTGTRDMENAAGDWYLLDQEMDKALKFSGYDYQFRIIDGGHVAGYGEYFQEAMAYLWKGWPARVKAGASAPRVQELLLPEEPWHLLAEGLGTLTGPAINARGEVFVAAADADKIYRIARDGSLGTVALATGHACGLTVAADGLLYSISSRTGKMVQYDAAGRSRPIMSGLRGHSILALPGGGFYVTAQGEKPGVGGTVWQVKDGRKTLVDSGLKRATGLAYRPDQWLLAVADGGSKWAYSYQMAADGTLRHKERFFWLHVDDGEDDAGAQSICYAREGQMLVATRSGIQVCADDGPTQVILPVPDRSPITGVCLGGPELDTLFAFCGGKVWQRKVRVHGLGAFTPWMKVPASKL